MYPLKIKSSFETGSQGEVGKPTFLDMLSSQGCQNGKPCCFHRSRHKISDDNKDGREHLLDSCCLPVICYALGYYTSQNLVGKTTEMNNLRLNKSPKSSVSELRFVPWSVWFQKLYCHRQSNFCWGGGGSKNLFMGMCLSSAACLF